MTDLNELLERVRSATGPDRGLDGDIAEALGLAPEGAFRMRSAPDKAAFGIDAYSSWKPDPFTSSVDAALALCERAAPGWMFNIRPKFCELRHPRFSTKDVFSFGQTTPLAILAALFLSLTNGASNVQ